MKDKITISLVKYLANNYGLTAATYNPGDGLKIKIIKGKNIDYFAASNDDIIWLCTSVKEAYAFLNGVVASSRNLISHI